jgi:membrane protein DedA with SNARE-associated domain
MSEWFTSVIIPLAQTLPIPLFVMIASFVEEIFPPIPSPAFLLLAGALAQVQNYPPLALLGVALAAALGKTVGAIALYFLVDKAEDAIVGRWGRFLGLEPGDLEKVGSHLGHGARDYIVLTVLRATPFLPSSVISVGCGLLKLPLRLYITATIIGTMIRDSFFIVTGYLGLTAVTDLVGSETSLLVMFKLSLGASLLALGGYYLWRRYRRPTAPPPNSDTENAG